MLPIHCRNKTKKKPPIFNPHSPKWFPYQTLDLNLNSQHSHWNFSNLWLIWKLEVGSCDSVIIAQLFILEGLERLDFEAEFNLMTSVETELVKQRGKDTTARQISKVIRKRKRCLRRIKRLPSPPTSTSTASSEVLQKLYDCCRLVFKGAGIVPPPCDVEKLCRILDGMRPEDVGLSKDLHFFKHSSATNTRLRVTKTTIYECKDFSLCIFFLPANAVIPLHNHPEMTVFSKLLLGAMHIKSFDWVDQNGSVGSTHRRLAKLKTNELFTAPCDTSVLYPTSGGNMHQFTAITPSAVLDVIGPPYSKDDGRDCTFYRDFPLNGMTKEGDVYGWLEEIDDPVESEMDGIEYMGPQIMETN